MSEKKINEQTVKHVAGLAMLKIEESELGPYSEQLSKILSHIDELEKVNTEGVQIFANPMRECMHLFKDHCDRREDEIHASLGPSLVLKNAPDQKLNQFKIEAVIAEE